MPKSETVQNGNKSILNIPSYRTCLHYPQGVPLAKLRRQALISKGIRRYRASQLADLLTLSSMGDTDS